jgi:hypothetical protein
MMDKWLALHNNDIVQAIAGRNSSASGTRPSRACTNDITTLAGSGLLEKGSLPFRMASMLISLLSSRTFSPERRAQGAKRKWCRIASRKQGVQAVVGRDDVCHGARGRC